jgi:hypothetical protein
VSVELNPHDGGRGGSSLTNESRFGTRRQPPPDRRRLWKPLVSRSLWATAYNIVAIPVAAGLFVHWGFDAHVG